MRKKQERKKINGLIKLNKNLKSVEERKEGKVEEEKNIYFYHLFIFKMLVSNFPAEHFRPGFY